MESSMIAATGVPAEILPASMVLSRIPVIISEKEIYLGLKSSKVSPHPLTRASLEKRLKVALPAGPTPMRLPLKSLIDFIAEFLRTIQ